MLAIPLPAFPPISYATSARIFRPGETLITQCTHLEYIAERIDERKIKAPTAASKASPTTFEGAWVFLSENAAISPGQQVKVHKSASFVDILEVCKFKYFLTERVIGVNLRNTLQIEFIYETLCISK